MQFIRGLHNVHTIPAIKRGVVLTIGGFDGVHRGHQALLAKLNSKARELKLPSMVISFEPSPREYFAKDKSTSRLQRLRDKVQSLGVNDIDLFACLRFDERLQKMSADTFVEKVLLDALHIRWLIVGHDFRFGCGRAGDINHLQQLGVANDFGVEEFAPFMVDQHRVSSTLVREALLAGDLDRAKLFLGRPYSIAGRVVYGNQLGRTLGFPTANIRLPRIIPLRGVFAVRVTGAGLHEAAAVASVGTVPVVNGIEPVGGECLQFHW